MLAERHLSGGGVSIGLEGGDESLQRCVVHWLERCKKRLRLLGQTCVFLIEQRRALNGVERGGGEFPLLHRRHHGGQMVAPGEGGPEDGAAHRRRGGGVGIEHPRRDAGVVLRAKRPHGSQAAIGRELHIGDFAKRLSQARRAIGGRLEFQDLLQADRCDSHLAVVCSSQLIKRRTGCVRKGHLGGGLERLAQAGEARQLQTVIRQPGDVDDGSG